ncbi:MAG: acyltransferase family protein [Firmicutes bacterium]|nr:acyltransferase family protein [Bacillota bacterium]
MGNTLNEDRRKIYLDLLRITAAFFIVMLHVCSSAWANTDICSHEWRMLNMYESASRWGVPVFVMISGALFLDRDIPLKKLFGKYILRIVSAFIFWSAVYAFIYEFLPGHGTARIIKAWISGPNHLWFLYMIAGFYMLTPIFRKIAQDDRLTEYFIILSLVFNFLIPQSIALIRLSSPENADWVQDLVYNFRMQLVLGYSPYYLLGYRLSRIKIGKKTKLLLYIAGIAGFIATFAGSAAIARFRGKAVETLYGYSTLNVFFMTIAVFLLFRSLYENKSFAPKARSIIGRLSKYSFGVYLVHVLIIRQLKSRLGIYCLSFDPLLCVPLLTVLVFLLSNAVSALLDRIPFVKKYLV